jgi:hypothetical protein
MRLPSRAACFSGVSATAILVITFLSTFMTMEVNGLVSALSMSGGLAPLRRLGDASISAPESA